MRGHKTLDEIANDTLMAMDAYRSALNYDATRLLPKWFVPLATMPSKSNSQIR